MVEGAARNPAVSVITPAYNVGDLIGSTIESVHDQTFEDWEMVVVDDGSTDDTVDVVEGWTNRDTRIRLIRSPGNRGAGPARTTALDNATGRYVAFLDSDDLWLPDKLERQVSFMADSNAYFSYTAYEVINVEGSWLRTIRVPRQIEYAGLLKNTTVGCLTVMIDRTRTGGLSMPAIPARQPLVLWLRLLREVGPAKGLDEVLAQYRVRSGSISRDKRKAAYGVWRVYRDYERLSLPRAAWYFGHYAVRGLLRNL